MSTTIASSIAFVAGFLACWFSKDWIIKAAVGTENFVKALEDKAAKIKAVL